MVLKTCWNAVHMVSKKTDSSPDSGPQVVITRWPSRPCFAANHAMHHAHVVIWRRMKGGDRYLTPLQHFNQSIVKHVQAKISWLIHTTDPWTDWYSHLHLVMSVSISIRQVRSWNGTWKRGSSLQRKESVIISLVYAPLQYTSGSVRFI